MFIAARYRCKAINRNGSLEGPSRICAVHCFGIKVIVKDSANVESAINKLMAKYVAFYNFDKGQLEDDVWLAFRGYFSEYLLPKSYDFWEKHRFMYGPAFREHVDSIPAKM